MSNLLDLALSAHGGLDRWNRFKVLQARMSVGGAIFVAKQNAGLQEDVTYEILTHEERVTIDRFAMPDRRLRFAPDRLTLETLDGSVVEDRHNPRDAFKGQTADSAWDTLHVGYFTSYALWTYLNLPFLYTYSGFSPRRSNRGERTGRYGAGLRQCFRAASPVIRASKSPTSARTG